MSVVGPGRFTAVTEATDCAGRKCSSPNTCAQNIISAPSAHALTGCVNVNNSNINLKPHCFFTNTTEMFKKIAVSFSQLPILTTELCRLSLKIPCFYSNNTLGRLSATQNACIRIKSMKSAKSRAAISLAIHTHSDLILNGQPFCVNDSCSSVVKTDRPFNQQPRWQKT